MPEPSRNDTPPRNPQYPQGAEYNDFSSEQWKDQPLHIYGRLPRSRAENFGHTVGSAVGRVLRFPDQARSRLRQAGRTTRAEASAVVLDMMDTAAQRTDHLRRNTEAALSNWSRNTRYRAERWEEQAAETWQELRNTAKERLAYASRQATARWEDARQAVSRVREEDPARFLMMVAGAAFVVGAGLRVWRSSSDE